MSKISVGGGGGGGGVVVTGGAAPDVLFTSVDNPLRRADSFITLPALADGKVYEHLEVHGWGWYGTDTANRLYQSRFHGVYHRTDDHTTSYFRSLNDNNRWFSDQYVDTDDEMYPVGLISWFAGTSEAWVLVFDPDTNRITMSAVSDNPSQVPNIGSLLVTGYSG